MADTLFGIVIEVNFEQNIKGFPINGNHTVWNGYGSYITPIESITANRSYAVGYNGAFATFYQRIVFCMYNSITILS